MAKDWATKIVEGVEKLQKQARKLWEDLEEELRLELEKT